MKQDPSSTTNEGLGEKFEGLIKRIPESEVTLMEIFEHIGSDGLLFFSIFLALVCLIPVQIPGIGIVFGAAILLIGISRLLNRGIWLPRRVANHVIDSRKFTGVLDRALVWFRWFERISRPNRFKAFAGEGKFRLLNHFSFILAAVLLMFPFGFVPFSNALPAAALIFFALGVIQKDGGCIFFGHLSNVASIAYFAALVLGGGMTMMEVIQRFGG
jgi:hypothetical protein